MRNAFLCLNLLMFLTETGAWAQAVVPSPNAELKTLLVFYDGRDMYPGRNPDLSDHRGGYFSWADCLPADGERSIVKVVDGHLDQSCLPDTLYTWQTPERVDEFRKMFSGPKWSDQFNRYALFTHINPVATFAYGYESLRFKLKPNTRFKLVTDHDVEGDVCHSLSQEELSVTVLVRNNPSLTDWILCSPGPIESWSVGTRHHYDEVVSSTLWYFYESTHRDWLPYRRLFPPVSSPLQGVASLFISDDEGGRKFDGHDFDQSQLINNLKTFRYLIDRNIGSVFIRHGSAADEMSHFATKHPIYWNSLTAP